MVRRLILRNRADLPSFLVKCVMSDFPGLQIELVVRGIFVGVFDMRLLPLHDAPD